MTRRLLPLALAGFAAVYIWQALTITLDPWSADEAINARTLPLVYGGGLLILGVWLALRPGPRPDGARPSPASPASRRRWRSLAAQCCAIVGFGVAIPWAGPWLALAGLLVAALLIAGERRWWVLVLAPTVTAALAWVLIAIVLEVYVDPGRWFS